MRDAESRTRFLGYRVEHYKLFVFVVSAMLAGIAGALYVPQVGIINPSEFSPANSIEIVIWVALGGRGTLVGAALGALIVAAGKSWLTANFPEVWLFVLGRDVHPGDDLPAEGRARADRGAARAAERWPGGPGARAGGVAAMQETQLYLQDVHRSFDGFKAINGLSMAIAKGELRAVVGPNGAGKTTMLDIITGKTRPDVGRVVWDEDTDLTRLDEADCARLGIGRKFQKPTVFETLTVETNLMLALAGKRGVAATLFHRLTRRRSDADRTSCSSWSG